MLTLPKSIEITPDGRVIILDQTQLPTKKLFIEVKNVEQMWEAIKSLRVRGAPLIGCAAAAGMYIGAKEYYNEPNFKLKLKEIKDYLASSRPTAVNLFWALDRVWKKIENLENKDEIVNTLLEETKAIIEEDINLNRKIGEYGLEVIKDNDRILTHCNAGSLATSYYGTALAPIYIGKEKGYNFTVYVDETRPLLQGARLTAWELKESGIKTIVISDNMAGWVMKNKMIDKIIIGADRIAANGDTANKIGSYSLSILAKYHNIPLYIAAPYSTIDMSLKSGDQIPIEERDKKEIIYYRDCQIAPEDVDVFNPAFDVVPHENITAIITDKGIIYPPFEENLKNYFK